MDGLLGFEPRFSTSKADVLPLDDNPIYIFGTPNEILTRVNQPNVGRPKH